MTDVNPFAGHGPLVQGERFVGRDRERHLLSQRLFQARSSAALIGLAGMGKSALASKVLAEGAAADGALTGRVSLSAVRCGADVLAEILAMCPRATAVYTPFTNAGRAADTPAIQIHDLYKMIRNALLHLHDDGGHLVVFLDEFDSVREFPDARDFLNLLRELVYSPDQVPIAVLTVARRPIDRVEIAAAGISSFAGVCDTMYLRPMGYEQIQAMAARSSDLPGGAVDVAWKYAAGHPTLSEVAFRRMLEYETIDIGRVIQPDLSSYYKRLERFMRGEGLWEPLLKLAVGLGVTVHVEEASLVRSYGLIDENGEVWSPDFAAYLRPVAEAPPQ
jgi:hypothetical protein